MKIEALYPELTGDSGDRGNLAYLKMCVRDLEFVETGLFDEPLFNKERPALIVMGTMTESTQERVIAALAPYRERLGQLIDDGVPMLFTGNAGEVLFEKITDWDGREIPGLGLFPFTAKRERYDRYNGLCLGETAEGITTTGFRSQFTTWYGDNSGCFFVKCRRGRGLDASSVYEGVTRGNAILTQQLGPILVCNPDFTLRLIRLIGSDGSLVCEESVREAFEYRLKRFSDPNISVNS